MCNQGPPVVIKSLSHFTLELVEYKYLCGHNVYHPILDRWWFDKRFIRHHKDH